MKMFLFLKAVNTSIEVKADNFVADHHNQKLALALIWFLSAMSILGSIFGVFVFIGIIPPKDTSWEVWYYGFMTIVAMFSPYNILWCIHCMNDVSWHFYKQTMNE